MLALVLCLASFPQGNQDALERRVTALLERLRTDDIEGRERAIAELVTLGEPALPFLEKAEASADTALAAQLQAVILKIGRKRPVSGIHPSDRLKSRTRLLALGGGGRRAEGAVLSALGWLARHQEPDGGWSNDLFDAQFRSDPCAKPGQGEHDIGVTALAVLAFLGAGYSPAAVDEISDPFDPKKTWKPGEIVRKGLERLRSIQRKDGSLLEGGHAMIGHALATQAFCEAFAMTGRPEHKDSARRAVDSLLDTRNPEAAWRYKPRSGDNDAVVSGWCVLALHAASMTGLWKSDESVASKVIAWFDQATVDSKTGYDGPGKLVYFSAGAPEIHSWHETSTGIAMLVRQILSPGREDAARDRGMEFLISDLPQNQRRAIDGCYWYWGSLALFRLDVTGDKWRKWSEALNKVLVFTQITEGCAQGSWDPGVDRWGHRGGRLAVTALNALTLLTPVR